MRKIILIFLFILIFLPVFVFANTCNNSGATVIYFNGIFTSQSSAVDDKELLRRKFLDKIKHSDIDFLNGYNASHLAGGGDIIKSIMQVYGGGGLDYDLTNILRQVHNELSTRKILLVGHSQGTFYTNAAYDYLVKNGVQKDSISVYNVATPADRVADGGNYLTSSKDKVINEVVRRLIEIGSARIPLLANIDILPGPNDQDSVIGGHSLSKTYLIGAPDRIIGDMKKELDGLSPTDFSEKSVGGCFIAPPNDLTHRLQGAGFFVGDGAANFIASSYRNSVSAGQLVYKTIYSGLASLYNFGQGFLSGLAQVFNGSRFFGASLTSTPILIELTQESSNPSEVRPRSDLVEVPVTESLVLNNNQELIDDILERIDLLRRQIADLEAAEKLKQQNLTQNQNQVQEQGQVILASQTMQQNNLSLTTYSGSGG